MLSVVQATAEPLASVAEAVGLGRLRECIITKPASETRMTDLKARLPAQKYQKWRLYTTNPLPGPKITPNSLSARLRKNPCPWIPKIPQVGSGRLS